MTIVDKVTLGGREFQLVKNGLDERQVRAFVDELTAQLMEARESTAGRPPPSSLDRLAEQTVLQAEKLADQLKEEAKQVRTQARVEAERIMAQAKAGAQEQAEALASVAAKASEQAQRVVKAAREKAAFIEADGKRKAKELVEFTKRRIEAQVQRDVKGASEKLLDYVDDMVREVRALSVNLDHWEDVGPEVSLPAAEAPQPQPPAAEAAAPQPQPPAAEAAAPQPQPPAAESTLASAEGQGGDSTVHEGPLQLVIQAPVNLAGLGEIYERLVQLRDVTLRDTRKADDGSYVISLSLGHPTPLLSILRHLENVAVARVGPPGDGSAPPASDGPTATNGTRIVVRLKG